MINKTRETQIRTFLNAFFDSEDIINISYIEEPEPEDRDPSINTSNMFMSKLPAFSNTKGFGTFFCPNPFKNTSVRSQDNLAKIKTLFVDFDDIEINPDALAVKPNIINTRDNTHWHLYYLIKPVEANESNLKKYKAILNFFVLNFGADKWVTNPANLIRVPYTIHYKTAKSSFYKTKITSKKRYTLDELIKIFGITIKTKEKILSETKTETKTETETETEELKLKTKIENFNPALFVFNRIKNIYRGRKYKTGTSQTEESLLLYNLGLECRDWALPLHTALDIADKLNPLIFEPIAPRRMLEHQIKSAYKYARNEPGQRLKDFEEADEIKKQKKVLAQAHKEEQAREALKDYVFVLSSMRLIHKYKNIEYATDKQISYFLLSHMNTDLSMDKILFRGLLRVMDKMDFMPNISKKEYVNEQGEEVINLYQGLIFEKLKTEKSELRKEDKLSVDIFKNHIEYLTNDEYEYTTLVRYIAHNLQFPGKKIPYAPLLINKSHGTGRSWLGELFAAIQKDYSLGVGHNNLKFGYTQYAVKRLTIFIHEIRDSDKFSLMDRLKSFITEPDIYIEEKFTRSYKQTNTINCFFFSNYSDALKIDNKDRRLLVILSKKPPQDKEYYKKLYGILNNINQLSALYDWLMSYDLSDYDIYERPEMTKGKREMIEANSSELSLFLTRMQEEQHILFTQKGLLVRDLQSYVEMYGSNLLRHMVSEKRLTDYLIEEGYVRKDFTFVIRDERKHRRIWLREDDNFTKEDFIKLLKLDIVENEESFK